MEQIKTGAIRDFRTDQVEVHLVRLGQLHPFESEVEKNYMVHLVPANQVGESVDGDYIVDHENQQVFYFDNWTDAQAKYLELADQYGAPLKVREFSLQNWKGGII